MRLKARLGRLEAHVEWLRFWGALRVVEMKLELIAKQKALEEHKARREEAVRRPPPSARPKAEAPPASPPLPPIPSQPEAVAPAAPVAMPPPRPPPVEETHDIPEHMQIRPVRWVPAEERWISPRPHRPEDDDYDPFAEFDDD